MDLPKIAMEQSTPITNLDTYEQPLNNAEKGKFDIDIIRDQPLSNNSSCEEVNQPLPTTHLDTYKLLLDTNIEELIQLICRNIYANAKFDSCLGPNQSTEIFSQPQTRVDTLNTSLAPMTNIEKKCFLTKKIQKKKIQKKNLQKKLRMIIIPKPTCDITSLANKEALGEPAPPNIPQGGGQNTTK